MEISAPESTRAILPVRFVAQTESNSNYVTVRHWNPNISFPPNVDFTAAVVPNVPASVEWASLPFEKSHLGGRFAGQVTVRRPEGHDVSLALLTSQVEADKKERDAKQIRLENVVENGDDFSFEIYVPNGFPVKDSRRWTYAIRADVKSQDGKAVVHSAFTRLRRSTARKALELAIDGPEKNEFQMHQHETLAITGTISRLSEIESGVTVQLFGIPEKSGVTADPVSVDASSGRFTLKIDASAAPKPVKLDNLTLRATFDSDNLAIRDVQSNNVVVKIGDGYHGWEGKVRNNR